MTQLNEKQQGGALTPENMIYIGILIMIFGIIRYYYKKSALEKTLRHNKEQSFLVPKEGGALQRMRKDNDGNITLKLAKKIKITGDTYIFRFSF